MRIAVFSTKPYDEQFLTAANKNGRYEMTFYEARLTADTVGLARDYDAVCVFVNDQLGADTIAGLAKRGVKLIALRCAGFNNVDLAAAAKHNIKVVRVPAYSPHAVAEHTLALLLCVNRKIHRAYARVREGNFALEGLLGFDIYGKTVGVIGTGKIGINVARIFQGFGCKVLAYDLYPNEECKTMGVEYQDLPTLFARSDIVTLHCPLTPETYHLINRDALAQMKAGVTIINTSRGALIDTTAVIDGLKSGRVGYLAIDVYEEESDLFFEDLSSQVIQDDVFARLITLPNVVVTGHQGFFTNVALYNIAETTIGNIADFEQTGKSVNEVTVEKISG
jgi:D-lactate dehydrogenase